MRLAQLALSFLLVTPAQADSNRTDGGEASYRLISATCQPCRLKDWLSDFAGTQDCGAAEESPTPSARDCVANARDAGIPFHASLSTQGSLRAVFGMTSDGGLEEIVYGNESVFLRSIPCRAAVVRYLCRPREHGVGMMMYEARFWLEGATDAARLSEAQTCAQESTVDVLCADRWHFHEPGRARPVSELRCEAHAADGYSACRPGRNTTGLAPARSGPSLLCANPAGDAGLTCMPEETARTGAPGKPPAEAYLPELWDALPCEGARSVRAYSWPMAWVVSLPDGGAETCPSGTHLFEVPEQHTPNGGDILPHPKPPPREPAARPLPNP